MVRAAVFFLALCTAAAANGQPQEPQAAPKAAVKPAAKPAVKKTASRPAWAELPAEQQQVLSPLKTDWESLERARKLKWIGIAKRYPKMKPQEQERVQRRMQAWAKLTPEQRRQARENYREIAKVPPEKRQNLRQQWADYQALPPSQRQTDALPEAAPKKKKK
jgi:hypothetical protein